MRNPGQWCQWVGNLAESSTRNLCQALKHSFGSQDSGVSSWAMAADGQGWPKALSWNLLVSFDLGGPALFCQTMVFSSSRICRIGRLPITLSCLSVHFSWNSGACIFPHGWLLLVAFHCTHIRSLGSYVPVPTLTYTEVKSFLIKAILSFYLMYLQFAALRQLHWDHFSLETNHSGTCAFFLYCFLRFYFLFQDSIYLRECRNLR